MTRPNVLVVDDDRDFAESVGDLLAQRGCDVELAFRSEAALDKFGDRAFDLTLMDIMLPDRNGVESFLLMRRLKPGARIAMMTGYSVPELVEKALAHGVWGVLNKPLDTEVLLRLVHRSQSEGVVLVVDDDRDFVASMETLLAHRGYVTIAANGVEDAVERALGDCIDVMILDLRLGERSGLDVYAELARRGRTLPTVVLTGYAQEEAVAVEKLRALAGAACLTKPFDPGELFATLQDLIPGEAAAAEDLAG